jgi:Periplasmic copper-binding protein (NosD)
MPVRFTLPPDTRAVGQGNPPVDMNGVVDCLNGSGYQFNILNTAWAGGAFTDGTSDSTAAIQACMNAAAAAGQAVFIPGGVQFRISQLTWNAGQVIQGVYSGTYPGNNAITTASVLTRLASTNLDMITVPDTINYGAIRDLALDGNKNNNSAGCGFKIADGAAASESQIFVERCYVHDNPDSNIYLGHFRRCNKVIFCVCNFSGAGDGVTDTGSDNLIQNCVCGSNFRAGINLGTSATQNWAAFGSNQGSNVAHVTDNDVYGNQVGIAIASFAANAMVRGNGIDRNTKQGITVYDGTSNCIEGNSLHSNGTLTNNTYAHIDVAAGVTGVNIAHNNVGPLDAGVTNVASWVVNVAAGTPAGAITGNIGVFDATDVVGGLINLPAKRLNPPGAASVSFAPANPTATASASLVMMGLGTTCTFTPKGSGSVMATACGFWNTATASINGTLSARFGTGTAPANAAAVTGTRWGTGTADASINAARTQSGAVPFSFTQVITGLTAGTAYWFDLTTSTTNAADSATITNVEMTFVELPS